MNDFRECLEFSHSVEKLPFWEEAYRKAFPTLSAMVSHRKNGQHQKAGIDRSVLLEDGRQVMIDEKVRRKNEKTGKVYSDIALEYIDNTTRGTPGWVCKPLLCDYIAYAIAPLGKCYLLPTVQLQHAWKQHGSYWKGRYPRVQAKNKGYWTISVGVPPEEVFSAIGACLRVDFEPLDI